MLKKIICMVIFMMSIFALTGCQAENPISTVSPAGKETIIHERIILDGVELNEAEIEIYDEYGYEVTKALVNLRVSIEERNIEIIREYVGETTTRYYVCVTTSIDEEWGLENGYHDTVMK